MCCVVFQEVPAPLGRVSQGTNLPADLTRALYGLQLSWPRYTPSRLNTEAFLQLALNDVAGAQATLDIAAQKMVSASIPWLVEVLVISISIGIGISICISMVSNTIYSTLKRNLQYYLPLSNHQVCLCTKKIAALWILLRKVIACNNLCFISAGYSQHWIEYVMQPLLYLSVIWVTVSLIIPTPLHSTQMIREHGTIWIRTGPTALSSQQVGFQKYLVALCPTPSSTTKLCVFLISSLLSFLAKVVMSSVNFVRRQTKLTCLVYQFRQISNAMYGYSTGQQVKKKFHQKTPPCLQVISRPQNTLTFLFCFSGSMYSVQI